jgi:hypothetical protein
MGPCSRLLPTPTVLPEQAELAFSCRPTGMLGAGANAKMLHLATRHWTRHRLGARALPRLTYTNCALPTRDFPAMALCLFGALANNTCSAFGER